MWVRVGKQHRKEIIEPREFQHLKHNIYIYNYQESIHQKVYIESHESGSLWILQDGGK